MALFQIPNAMSRNNFLMQLVPIWWGFLNRASCDISSNFCASENKDSQSRQWFKPAARTNRRRC